MNRLSFLVVLAIICLAGCMSSGTEIKQEQFSTIQKGVTTCSQVESKFGKPTTVTTMGDGSKQYLYMYQNTQVRATTLIPYVGIFAGGADTKSDTATFSFDKNGILTDYTSTQSNIGVDTGLLGGGK